jgi:hypothetical protein
VCARDTNCHPANRLAAANAARTYARPAPERPLLPFRRIRKWREHLSPSSSGWSRYQTSCLPRQQRLWQRQRPAGGQQAQPGAPSFGSGGSFLGTAASAAAGVIGGSLLLDGIHSLGSASASAVDREQDRQQDLADDDREQDAEQDLADEDAQQDREQDLTDDEDFASSEGFSDDHYDA